MNSEKNKNPIIKISNDLVDARYGLSQVEQKLIIYILSVIDTELDEFNMIEISANDFLNFIKSEGVERYTEFKRVARGLKKKELFITQENGNEIDLNWVSSCEYKKNEGVIEFEFSRKLVPYLLKLREKFTQFGIENIVNLTNKYSFRFYTLFKSNLYKGITQEYELDFIREKFELKDKYPRFRDFKRFVLDKCIDEINEFTDIEIIDFETIRKSRRIHKIAFKVKYKNASDELALSMDKESLKDIEKQVGLQDFNFTNKQLEELYVTACEIVGENPYIEVYEYMRKTAIEIKRKKGIKDEFGFYKEALKKDYYNIKNQMKLSI